MLFLTFALLVAPAQIGEAPPVVPSPVASPTPPVSGQPASVSSAPPADGDQQASPPTVPAPVEPAPVPPVPVEPVPSPSPSDQPATGATSAHTEQADVVVTGQRRTPGDPLRAVNAQSFAVTQKFDGAVLAPLALAYKHKVPSPIRTGIHNFLYNLREPIVFLNFLLQFKPGKAAETVGRFVINSTAGIAGVLDVARKKPFHLPRRSNGFADTLGYHGIGNGPFLFLPIVGPTTLRDLLGGFVDRVVLPVAVGKPFTSPGYTVPAAILGALDHRADFDDTLHVLHDGAADPYASSRKFYLERRQEEIDHLHGRHLKRVTAESVVSPGDTTAAPSSPGGMSDPPPTARPAPQEEPVTAPATTSPDGAGSREAAPAPSVAPSSAEAPPTPNQASVGAEPPTDR